MGDEVKFTSLINIPHIADCMHEIDWMSGMLNLAYFLGHVSAILWFIVPCNMNATTAT